MVVNSEVYDTILSFLKEECHYQAKKLQRKNNVGLHFNESNNFNVLNSTSLGKIMFIIEKVILGIASFFYLLYRGLKFIIRLIFEILSSVDGL